MAQHRHEGPGENGDPIPRDLPDQQVHEGEDPWDVGPAADAEGESEGESATDVTDDVPDTDEAGTGRHGEPRSGAVHPEHPAPDESSA